MAEWLWHRTSAPFAKCGRFSLSEEIRPYCMSAIAKAIAKWQALDLPLLQCCISEIHHPMERPHNCKGGGYPIDCCVCRFDSCS
ncbi:hypothetical protein TNIN_345041 [Trichonephila inaurata madagascariensis]|uniref:Uncharacterized protein n=1 Tax=Trichonephila inaurata madagascariensis TaxID=2747483 RepID=A0A8X6YG42_9ARAC|nr:hypothetical protein TNIN_345041 [Trichonephila inaurata madagascariensis]